MPYIDKVAWLLLREGRILSTRTPGRTIFHLPGGKIAANETPLEALSREIQAELAVTIRPASTRWLDVFEAQAPGHLAGVLVRLHCYFAEHAGDLPARGATKELSWLGYEARTRCAAVDRLVFDRLHAEGGLRTTPVKSRAKRSSRGQPKR